MSDIKKGYTFTDKSTDWVSNKETAIRLNKMVDDAKLNLVAGTNISITPTANGPSISASGGTVTAVTGTLPIVSTGTTAPNISINAATTLLPGSMSAADKSKLDGIEAGAQVNVATNLAYTDSTRVLTSSTGTDVTLPLVGADPGLMTAADKTKLDGIAAGAQVNVATNLAQGTRTTTTVPVTSSTGTPATLDVATTSLAGVMSSTDKSKLDGIAANANNYSLPKATSTVLGGVELFDDTVQTVASNAVTTTSARTYGVQLNSFDQMVVNVPWIDSTFAAQTEKTFFAGPASSPSATPTFRVIASTDLPAFGSGDVAFAVGGGAGTIASNVIYNANINSGAAIDYSKLAALNSTNILVGSSANVATSTAVTGDVTISNTGVTTIGADKVTNTQLANMGATTVKVNATTSTADPTDLSVGTNTVVGRVAGDIVAAQVVTDQIADNAVTNAKAAQMATQTIKGRTTASTGPAEDLTATQATAILNPAVGATVSVAGTKGLVPAPAIGDQVKFLRGDMTYQTVSGGGGIADGDTLTTGLTFPVSGLHILDTDASHDLIISPGSNLTADRTLTITTGDANRTVTLTGDTSLIGTNTGDNATNTQYSGLVSNANHTGDATGSTELTISNGVVTLVKMANLAANSFIANNTGVAATPIAVTTAQATAMLNTAVGDAGSGGTKGLVPAPAIGDSVKFLRGDMTYQTISGGGDALTSNPLSQFAPTTSAQLAGVISDETGTGLLVFATSPTLITPLLGTPTSGLLNSCTSNPNATGATARTFQARAGDVFNVKDFGAAGDDSNDDTTAIAAALLAACSASRGATVYFPHGTYKVSDTFTGSFGVNNQMYGLTITGDGIGTTIIKQYGTNKGVFHITNTAVAGCLTLKDFSCWNQPGVMSTLQCIRYEVSQIAADDAHTNLQVSNLSITPPFGAGTWTIGLDLYRVHNGSITNYQYAGDNAGGGTGIVFQKSGSSASVGANKSMACFIQGCQMNLCNTGVRIKDAMETCLIQECVMVGLVYGVYSDYCIHLGVSNSHINVNPAAYVAGTFVVGLTYEILSLGSPTPTDFTLIGAASNTVGVVFTATGVGAGNGLAGIPGVACIFSSATGGDVDQSIIVGNLLYSQGYSNLMGIKGGFVRSSFSGNSFIALGGQTGTRGISVTGKGLSITGNSFYQHTDSYITSSATYSIISSNTATIDPGAVATTPYGITGTGTTSANNIYEP